LDDIAVASARVHNLRERFDDLENDNEDNPTKQGDNEAAPPL
jgi:hypothetical protein